MNLSDLDREEAAIRQGGGPKAIERQHDKRLAPISAHDQQITVFEPAIKLAKAVCAHFDFDAPILAQQRHRHVADVLAAQRAAQGHALGSEAAVLKQPRDGALLAVALLL